MGLNQEQVDELMEKNQENYDKAFKTGDALKLSEFYEPNSILIKKSSTEPKVWFGRAEIAKALEPFVANAQQDFKVKFEHNFAAANDDYIIHRGSFEFGGKRGPYEQIWHKQKDGNYLIVRDEFEI